MKTHPTPQTKAGGLLWPLVTCLTLFGLLQCQTVDLGQQAEPGPASTPGGTKGLGTAGSLAIQAANRFYMVDVHYATDRAPVSSEQNVNRYGGGRNRKSLEYGKTVVAIPFTHQTGVLESPKWYKMELVEDPQQHIVVLRLNTLSKDTFFRAVDAGAAGAPEKHALIYIHGFNAPFRESIRRTAQIAYDLNFPGVAIAYSWPSQGSLATYVADRQNVEWTAPHLAQLLMDLRERTGIERIHIIAHSMGAQALGDALTIAYDRGFNLQLNNVILAAPDIDADTFKDQIMPKIAPVTSRLTMYASSGDEALEISRRINGNDRLGLSGDNLVVLSGMDTVDASHINTSLIGHSYFSGQRIVIDDIRRTIIQDRSPSARGLRRERRGNWIFPSIDSGRQLTAWGF